MTSGVSLKRASIWRKCFHDMMSPWNIDLNLIYFNFQTYLDAFAEAANSPYGCLFIRGSVAAATKKWWELSRLELMLLSLLITSAPPSTARDVPVFLPISSPKVGCVTFLWNIECDTKWLWYWWLIENLRFQLEIKNPLCDIDNHCNES